eukprot:2435056-Ditylum_brightwellii.AAC.1
MRFCLMPEDKEICLCSETRHKEMILPPIGNGGNIISNLMGDNTSVLTQLTSAMSRQPEYVERANKLRREALDRNK